MFNPDTAPHYGAYLQSFKALPQRNSVEIEAVHVRSITEIEMAVAKLGHEPVGGLIAAADVFIVGARAKPWVKRPRSDFNSVLVRISDIVRALSHVR